MSETGLTISQVEGVTVVDFRNASILDAAAVEAVEAELYALVDEQQCTSILLDLSEVRFLASQMLGSLVALHKKAGDIGGRVVLCGLRPFLFRVFQMSRLDTALHFAPNVREGLKTFEVSAEGKAPGGPAEAPGPSRWERVANRQIRILFAGALVVVPLAVTIWVVWSIGSWLDELGYEALRRLQIEVGEKPPPGPGALIVLAGIYLLGLLTHLWIFRGVFGLLERLVARVPGIKTIYESVRDLMQLFGGESRSMGRVVQYNVPGTDMAVLGILTNEQPRGVAKARGKPKVAVYLPYSYMLGGPTVFVSREQIVEVDMSVEECLKLCTTAQVGSPGKAAALPRRRKRKAKRKDRPGKGTKGGTETEGS